MKKRRVEVTVTQVQYRQQTIEVDIDDSVSDDDICEELAWDEFEIDDNIEWIDASEYYEEDDIPNVDSNRYDVYRGNKHVTGGHL